MLLLVVAIGAIVIGTIVASRPDLSLQVPPVLTLVAAAASAVAVGLSDAAPTGWQPLDIVLRVGLGALVPLAAARAGNVATSWLLLVATITLLITEPPAALVGGVAAGAFWALAAARASSPAARAMAVAAALGPMAHADWPVASGVSALAVGVAVLPVLLAGLVRTPRPARTRILLATGAVVVVLGLGTVAGLAAALQARTDVDRAVDFAVAGIDLLGDDDDRARTLLLDAAGAFETTDDTLRVWWARPALLVPVVAQQHRAVSTMASSGADLARVAADATDEADVDSVRPRDGRVDLDALAALSEPLQRSLDSLRTAETRLTDVRSPVLLTPVAERLERLQTEVDDALVSAELASQAVDVAPGLLGADGPRRYFIAFQNPAESTANGGFLGNWAELVIDDGQLSLARSGRNRELTQGGADPEGRRIEGEPEFVSIYGQSAARFWGNINFTPDHPTVSRIIAQLYPQSGGDEIDGVIALTPGALAAFLELTGPIEVAGYPEQLNSENVERILLHEQYLSFPQEASEDRETFLTDTVEALFDQLTSGELPGPRAIAAELGPAVEARGLQLWAVDSAEQALFERLGADGGMTRSTVDSFGIVTQNLNGNKIDWFLHRDIAYDAEWDPDTSEVTATLSATIRNEAPDSGLPASVIGWGGDESLGQIPVADGENLLWLTVYSTLPIERITLDGEPVDFAAADELGHRTGRFVFPVPSESVREVVAELRGVVEKPSRYVLRALRQPMVNADSFSASLRVPSGWEVDEAAGGTVAEDSRSAVTRQDATSALQMTVDVRPTDDRIGPLERLRTGAR